MNNEEILKSMSEFIGERCYVLEGKGYYGTVESVKDIYTFIVVDNFGVQRTVSINNIRALNGKYSYT